MKRRLLSAVLALCTILTFAGPLAQKSEAYGVSDWVPATEAPENAEVVERKYTYTKTTTVKSYATSMDGFQQVGWNWVWSSGGSQRWADFPAGFDTGHSLYQERVNGQPYWPTETATYKREVRNNWAGFIYWHWCYNVNYSANNTQRMISSRKNLGYYVCKYFYAFRSNTDWYKLDNSTYYNYASSYNTKYNKGYSDDFQTYNCKGDEGIVNNGTATNGLGTPRFFRFDCYWGYYDDYYKQFTYQKVEELESNTDQIDVGSDETISNMQEWVKYKNSFTISFDANGGSGAPAAQTKTFGTPLTLTSEKPVRSGYEFLGWSVSKTAIAADYSAGGSFSPDTGDQTLYAVWKNKTQYTVTYDYKTNGGTSCPTEKALVYLDEKANLGVTPVKDGWTFVGWNTDKNAHAGLKEYVVKSNATLYAIYSRTVTASLYIGDKQLYSAPKGTYYNNDAGYALELPAIPSNGDWTSLSWVAGGTDHMPGTNPVLTADTRFDAKYVKNLTLSYNANGGSAAPASQTVALYFLADGSYQETKPVLAAAITRPGYSFDKWAYGSAAGKTYAAGDTIDLRENTTMFATWTELPQLEAPKAAVKNSATGKTVTLTGPAGAVIHYTTDGSSPTASSATYSKAIGVTKAGTTTIKAIAVQSGCADSAVTIETVTLEQAAAPKADRESGELREGMAVTLTGTGTIYYTLDGKNPNTSSAKYTEPVVISDSVTLKAIAAVSGKAVSKVVTYNYTAVPAYEVDTYGYSFGNIASSFGYTNTKPSFLNYCIPYSSVKMIFGDSVKGKSAYTSMAKYSWNGNCCGMASTSALIYSTSNDISASDFGQTTVSALKIGDTAAAYDNLPVRTFIEAMQISQYTVQFDRAYAGNKVSNQMVRENGSNFNRLYQAVKSDLGKGKNDIIAVGQTGVGAHALLAYKLTDDSPTQSSLYVYDCNYPKNGERIITLTKNASGDVVGWTYPMGSYGVWGTASERNSYLSYVPFDIVSYIWEHRGDLNENYLTLTVNSRNVAITNLDGETVGEFIDGEFYAYMDDIYAIPNLNLTTENDLSVYLPEDFYVVSNNDGGDFEAAMVGDGLGATVSTDAETICFEMNESLNLNSISIEQAASGSNYTISLDSSRLGSGSEAVFNNVTLVGNGTGDTLRLSALGSALSSVENCTVSSYKINGVEQITYTVTASAGKGGSVSPKGDVSIASGGSQTFTFTPEPGYRVSDVMLDGVSMGAMDEYEFDDMGRNHVLRVNFARVNAAIESATLSGTTLTVVTSADTTSRVMAAVYDTAGQLLQLTDAQEGNGKATFNLSTLPSRYTIKVFLFDEASGVPLCDARLITK